MFGSGSTARPRSGVEISASAGPRELRLIRRRAVPHTSKGTPRRPGRLHLDDFGAWQPGRGPFDKHTARRPAGRRGHCRGRVPSPPNRGRLLTRPSADATGWTGPGDGNAAAHRPLQGAAARHGATDSWRTRWCVPAGDPGLLRYIRGRFDPALAAFTYCVLWISVYAARRPSWTPRPQWNGSSRTR